MNQMNGRKVLQEQAHGRGKNNQRARYHESFRRWFENLIAMNEQTNAMIGTELLETAAKLGLVAVIALSVVGDLSASSAPAEATSSFDGSNTAPKATGSSCGEPDPQ